MRMQHNTATKPAPRRSAAVAVRRQPGALPLVEQALRLFMWGVVALFSLLLVVVMVLG